MQNPEVWSFQEPQPSFEVEELSKSFDKFDGFYFNHLVSVVLPDSLRVPENLVGILSNDCEYYKILDFNLSDLLNVTFLTSFIDQGELTLLSIGTRIDCDNCVAITPTGYLILSLKKETYQTLGLEGKVSHFTKKNKDRCIVKINLKKLKLQPGKANYERIKDALDSLERFTVILSWNPPDKSVCPSSVAKFFDNLKCNVKVCKPKFKTHLVYSVKTPTLEESRINEIEFKDFIEWLGIISVEGALTEDVENYVNKYEVPEPNIKVGPVRFLQWKGFYQPHQIMQLVTFLKRCSNDDKLWIAVCMQSFSDAPVTEINKEHHYFTNGDNAKLLILNKSKVFCLTHRCSAKTYK